MMGDLRGEQPLLVHHKIDVVKLYLARNPLLASKYFQNSYGVLMLPLALCFESNPPSARKTEALELLLAACNNALELLLSLCPASGLGESVLAVAASMLHFLVQAVPPPPGEPRAAAHSCLRYLIP